MFTITYYIHIELRFWLWWELGMVSLSIFWIERKFHGRVLMEFILHCIKLFNLSNLFSLTFSSYAFLCTLQRGGGKHKIGKSFFFGNEIVDDRTNEFTLSAYYYAPSSSNFHLWAIIYLHSLSCGSEKILHQW